MVLQTEIPGNPYPSSLVLKSSSYSLIYIISIYLIIVQNLYQGYVQKLYQGCVISCTNKCLTIGVICSIVYRMEIYVERLVYEMGYMMEIVIDGYAYILSDIGEFAKLNYPLEEGIYQKYYEKL